VDWGDCVHLHAESADKDDAEEDVVLAEDGAVGKSQRVVENGRGRASKTDL